MIYLTLLLILIFPISAAAQDLPDNYEYFFTDNKGLTVVGTKQTSQQIAVIEKDQIKNSGASDLTNLLQETLGLNIVRHGAYGNQTLINLRGFDSKRVAFLINGIQVNPSSDGRFDISQIDLNSIERIEVIYGGSDSKFNVSGAFGGVVNIITAKKQDQGLRFSASISNTSFMPGEYRNRSGVTSCPHWEDLLDTQNYSLSAAYGSGTTNGGEFSLTANISANRAENHFLFTDRYNHTRRKDNNEVWDTGANVSLIWELPNLTKLITSSNFNFSDRNFPSTGFSSRVGNQQDFSTRQNFIIDMPHVLHDKFSTDFSLSWQFHNLEYTSPSNEISLHNQHSLSAVNRWNWFVSDWLTLDSGIDYRYISLDSTEMGIHNRHDGGFYFTARLLPLQQLLIIPSAKIVYTSCVMSFNIAIIPKLGLLWNVTDNFDIKNNYFRNFKFPDFEELYWNGGGGIGNPNLRPEDGWGADLGMSWRVTNTLQLESVFFTQWIQDSIHWFAGSSGIWRPENVGEAVFFGSDSKVIFNIPVSIGFIKEITTFISYQYLISYLLSYGYTFDSNKRIPYNPIHTIFGSLGFSWDNGSFSISGRYEGLRFHDTANLTALKPVFLLNAGFNQKINNNLAVFGALRNILNTSYESFYDYPMPGITLTLGVRFNLEVKQ
jgi:vitamin B12 transporter